MAVVTLPNPGQLKKQFDKEKLSTFIYKYIQSGNFKITDLNYIVVELQKQISK